MKFSNTLPLLVGLNACAEPIEALEVKTSPSALCSTELTLADQLNTSERLGTWINEAIADDLKPGIDISIDRESMDLPEALDKKIPGNIGSFGVITYPHELDDPGTYVTATRTDESYYLYMPKEQVTCDDLSFAYRVTEFPVDLTITGKCELNDDETLSCQGSFYDTCDINTNSPMGPYEDCTTAANYENAYGETFTLDLE